MYFPGTSGSNVNGIFIKINIKNAYNFKLLCLYLQFHYHLLQMILQDVKTQSNQLFKF